MAPNSKSPIARDKQLIGMRGVYAAAAELSRLGLIVSPTSRSAYGVDLLVTDPAHQRAWSVEVKTTERSPPGRNCVVSKHAERTASPTHIYIFVHFDNERPQFLVVPSQVVASTLRSAPRPKGPWYWFDRANAPYPLGSWDAFSVSEPKRRSRS
jgi:hypothetical protein